MAAPSAAPGGPPRMPPTIAPPIAPNVTPPAMGPRECFLHSVLPEMSILGTSAAGGIEDAGGCRPVAKHCRHQPEYVPFVANRKDAGVPVIDAPIALSSLW